MILRKFPIPPTSNRLLAPIGGRLIKTRECRDYDSKVDQYRIRNYRVLYDIEENFKDKLLLIDSIFVFARKRLIGKEGQIKRLDSSNRIKVAHDNLSRITNLDDKNFVSGYFERAYCENERDEQVIFKLTVLDVIRNYEDILF